VEPETRKVSVFRIVCQRMVMQGVKFPALKYFDMDEVKTNVPETLVTNHSLKRRLQSK
jgi:hypothetical protein